MQHAVSAPPDDRGDGTVDDRRAVAAAKKRLARLDAVEERGKPHNRFANRARIKTNALDGRSGLEARRTRIDGREFERGTGRGDDRET